MIISVKLDNLQIKNCAKFVLYMNLNFKIELNYWC